MTAPALVKRYGKGTDSDASDAVRRLVPVETERLQGFPDDWTSGADSRRYAAMGDAVTVPVITWIGHRLYAALAAEAHPTLAPAGGVQ